MKLTFEKTKSGGWFIVLPEWTGSQAALAMVAGADKLLDTFHDGSGIVTLEVYLANVKEDMFLLKRLFKSFGGAVYHAHAPNYYGPIWLCEVTKLVFGGHLPKRIYFKYLENEKI
jgi:hypothetical protein